MGCSWLWASRVRPRRLRLQFFTKFQPGRAHNDFLQAPLKSTGFHSACFERPWQEKAPQGAMRRQQGARLSGCAQAAQTGTHDGQLKFQTGTRAVRRGWARKAAGPACVYFH